MKPKNKFQREVVEFAKTLPSITNEQKQWAFKNLFEHIGRRLKNGNITCMECGETWQSEHQLAESICGCTCPNCQTELTIRDTRKQKFSSIEYFCILTKHKGHQVIRFFYMEQYTKVGEAVRYTSTEVVQRWIAPNGQHTTLAMLRPIFCWSYCWQWHSDL